MIDLDHIATLSREELLELPVETLRFLEWQARWQATARPEQLPPKGDWLEWGVQAGRGWGKALCFQTLIPTPGMTIRLKDVKVGDRLLDEKRMPCTVTAIFEPEITEAYRVTFSSGEHFDACTDHQWVTFDSETAENLKPRRFPKHWADCKSGAKIRTTKELFDTQDIGHIIPCTWPNDSRIEDNHRIARIERIDPKPMRCLTVDSPNSMFLIGDTYTAFRTSDPERIELH